MKALRAPHTSLDGHTNALPITAAGRERAQQIRTARAR